VGVWRKRLATLKPVSGIFFAQVQAHVGIFACKSRTASGFCRTAAQTRIGCVSFTDNAYGDLVSEYDGTHSYFHAYDGLGSSAALVDENANTTDKYLYRAFGLPTHGTGSNASVYQWVGQKSYRQDTETGLYLMGSGGKVPTDTSCGCDPTAPLCGKQGRYYDPVTGRFLNEDPSCEPDDTTLYRYVGNNPVNVVDPSGHEKYKPRGRACCLFWRPSVNGPDDIGTHLENKDGNVFTCRCGWVDTGHVREAMDLVLFLYKVLASGKSKKGDTFYSSHYGISFRLKADVPSDKFAAVAASMAWDVGLRYEIMSAWPNVVTWHSAFSPEDLPSNAIGILIAMANVAKFGAEGPDKEEWTDLMDSELKWLWDHCKALTKAQALNVWDRHVEGKLVGPSPKGRPWELITLYKRNTTATPWIIRAGECKGVDQTIPDWVHRPTSFNGQYYEEVTWDRGAYVAQDVNKDWEEAEKRLVKYWEEEQEKQAKLKGLGLEHILPPFSTGGRGLGTWRYDKGMGVWVWEKH
jgi:RHS repeat-associated protein